MKYKLETIPVWDAFDADSECPFCLLEKKADEKYLKYYLGSSVMAPETRVTVNARGFCRSHWTAAAALRGERHALSLLTHTRFTEAAAQSEKILSKIGHIGKNQRASAISELNKLVSGCVICERLEQTMKRYFFTAIHLWKINDQGFRQRYLESKGVCLKHLVGLVAMAEETLCSGLNSMSKAGKLEWKEWILASMAMQHKNCSRLEKELFDYSRSFDPQYSRKELNYRDESLKEGIDKLRGTELRP